MGGLGLTGTGPGTYVTRPLPLYGTPSANKPPVGVLAAGAVYGAARPVRLPPPRQRFARVELFGSTFFVPYHASYFRR